MERTCGFCHEPKELTEANFGKKGKAGFKYYCKPCQGIYDQCRLYGVTPEWIKSTLEEQNFRCAICKRLFESEFSVAARKRRAHVDHTEGGTVRGLLCHNCNVLLGHSDERVEWLEAAIQYLNEKGTKWDEDWP